MEPLLQIPSLPIPLLVALLITPLCALLLKNWLSHTSPPRPASEQPPRKLKWYRSGLPIIGPAIEFQKAPNVLLLKARRELGDVFGLNLLAKRFVFVTGPEAHRWFFNGDDGTSSCELAFEKAVQELTSHLFGNIMFVTPGWPERARKVTVTGLGTLQRLTYYTGIIQDEVDRSLAAWAQLGAVDLFRECSRLAMTLQIRCLLGDDVSEGFPELKDLYYDFEHLAALPEVAQFGWFPSATARRFARIRKRMFAILETVVNERFDRPDEHKGRRDYAQFVVENCPDYRQIVPAHLLSLMFAGHVNTAGTMGWNIAHIASDEALRRAVCAKVRSEGDPFARGADVSSMTSAGIAIAANRAELPLVDKCGRETNRLYGILILVRAVLKDTAFDGIALPKGTTVAFSPYVCHRDPLVYTDVNKFDPKRYSKAGLEELNTNRHYVPFGAGRHACQGQRFVTIILRIIWTTLFRDFEPLIENLALPEPEYYGALGTPLPKAPVKLRLRKRTEESS
ncbi:cytochrome P450 family 51 (sterol 14-demethylase) [Klebsormidium nitens]|uniref:Cytochrome P450 family 51 (Sterol 14-demethylase) n=1 Tax=Klebsormidium nitens TaxID=105231 RepID=A0A1Y1IVS3_KLENI|nr:cytochrome P450 family 51 (sterol 14-demethylase) [Klebsormidium nitens]|eukprot:GAQ92807.1 cytochrome P450 family 51 (sterol 14-demethylase) [Klebsormidium nitens]